MGLYNALLASIPTILGHCQYTSQTYIQFFGDEQAESHVFELKLELVFGDHFIICIAIIG